jgi:hypothetical protein
MEAVSSKAFVNFKQNSEEEEEWLFHRQFADFY